LRFYPALRKAIGVPGKEKKFAALLNVRWDNDLHVLDEKTQGTPPLLEPHNRGEKP